MMEIQAKSILVRVSEGFNLTVILLGVAVFIRGRRLIGVNMVSSLLIRYFS